MSNSNSVWLVAAPFGSFALTPKHPRFSKYEGQRFRLAVSCEECRHIGGYCGACQGDDWLPSLLAKDGEYTVD